MASVSSPYGIKPISDQSGLLRPVRIPLGIASGLASNILKYQPVKIVVATGTITPITAGTDPIFGVFAGVEFTPLGGRPTESPFWPSGTAYDTTLDMFAYIWPAWIPGIRWQVQADGSVAQALLGSQFNVTNFAAGNAFTGLSAATVGAAGVVAASQGQFALTEFATDIAVGGFGSSVPGDAFTDLIVTIARPQVGLGIQTSIG
jgi:hypothetical protein